MKSFCWMMMPVAVLILGSACSDDAVHLEPGHRYTMKADAPVTPCPGQWDDAQRVDDAASNSDRVRIVLSDGGTTLAHGDTFTVVGFGSGIDAPVRIRSNVNNALCWLSNGDIQDLIEK